MEVHYAAAESPLVEQLELEAHAVGKSWRTASDHHRREEQVVLVDQTGPDRLSSEAGTADAQVTSCGRFIRPTASGSRLRSSRVRALETEPRVFE